MDKVLITQIMVLAKQIVYLSLLGLTGFAVAKTGYLPEESGRILSKLVIKLTLPVLIFTSLINRKFTNEIVVNGISIYVFGLIFLLLSYFIAFFVCKRFRLEEATRSVYKMQSMFGNVIFLAFPLLQALFGKDVLIYAVFFSLANDTLLWTLGIYLVNKHNTSEWKDNLKHLINGSTIAFVSGLIFVICGAQAFVNTHDYLRAGFNLFNKAFTPLGETTTILSMLFIGMILAEVKINNFADLLQRMPVFVLAFFKLLVVPGITLLVMYFLGGRVDPFVKAIVILQVAMPCGTIVPALAAQYESDYKFATESAFFSTILSIVTLPLMYIVMNLFIKGIRIP